MKLDHDSRAIVAQTGSVSVEAPGPRQDLLELDANQAIALYQVGKMVTAGLDVHATLEVIADTAYEFTNADAVALALIEDDGSLVVRVGRGTVRPGVAEPLNLDYGATARAIQEGEAILVADMDAAPPGARPDPNARFGVRTFLAVPLIWRLEPVGVVTLTCGLPNALGPTHIALVGALAEQAAAAVKRSRDHAEERHLHDERQEMLRQFAEQATQLERVQQQLIQNEKLTAIGQLVQGLAHEMNTPLSVVITNLSVLGRHADNLFAVAGAAQQVLPQLLADPLAAALAAPLDVAIRGADLEYTLEDLPELLTDSTAAVRRVAELVRSMANFARRDTGGPTAVVVDDVLEAALTLASNPLKQCAKVVREFGSTAPVLGLTSELTELFLHLLINAAQALEERNGTVTISTSSEGRQVCIRISDTGQGISAELLPRVFDPFYTTRPVGGGTGMGLAVCYGIVARHNGTIVMDSAVGTGTTVTVRLPVAE